MMLFLGFCIGFLFTALLYFKLLVPAGRRFFRLVQKFFPVGKRAGKNYLRIILFGKPVSVLFMGVMTVFTSLMMAGIAGNFYFAAGFLLPALVLPFTKKFHRKPLPELQEAWNALFIKGLNELPPENALPSVQFLLTECRQIAVRRSAARNLNWHPAFAECFRYALRDPDYIVRRETAQKWADNRPDVLAGELVPLLLNEGAKIPDPTPEYYFPFLPMLSPEERIRVFLGLLEKENPFRREDLERLADSDPIFAERHVWMTGILRPSPEVKIFSVRRLGKLKAYEAIPELIKLLTGDSVVSFEASKVLNDLFALPNLPVLTRQKGLHELTDVLRRVPKNYGRTIFTGLRILNLNHFSEAKELFFKEFLPSDNPTVQDEAVSFLAGQWTDAELYHHLKIPAPQSSLRLGLLKVLKTKVETAPLQPFPELKPYLTDRNSGIRHLALELYMKYSEEPLPVDLLFDPDPEVVNLLLKRMKQLPDTRYLAPLFELHSRFRKKNSIFMEDQAARELIAAMQPVQQTAESILKANKKYREAFPNVYCSECLTYGVEFKEMKWKYVACPLCHSDRHLVTGVKTVYGVLSDHFFLKKELPALYVGLWNESEKKTRIAFINELIIERADGIQYDWAVNAVTEMLQNRLPSAKDFIIQLKVPLNDNSRYMLSGLGTILYLPGSEGAVTIRDESENISPPAD